MQQPWTVTVENLAPHAVPLGRWINKMLWRWSPWHLAHQLEEELERVRTVSAMLREEERRVRELYAVLQADRRTLVDMMPSTILSSAKIKAIIHEPDYHRFELQVPILQYYIWDAAVFANAARSEVMVEKYADHFAQGIARSIHKVFKEHFDKVAAEYAARLPAS